MIDLPIANFAAYLGSAIAMGLGAIGSGWGIGYAATGALRGFVRQPKYQSSIFRSMLISQAVAETPAIFALVISLLLYSVGGGEDIGAPGSLAQAAALFGAGLCIGIGALGSGAGSGIVAVDALESIARTPAAQGRVTIMMLIGQAWCQTPCIFALVVAIMLRFGDYEYGNLTAAQDVEMMGRFLGTAICMGAGAIGPALGISYVGAKVCKGIADAPESAQQIRNTLFVGAAVSESTAVYALVISLLLLVG
jgi:ATP synthase F0 subunit c